MNNLHIHNVKNINLTLPKAINQKEEYSHRELEIVTEEGVFRISLYGTTVEDIKFHMEL